MPLWNLVINWIFDILLMLQPVVLSTAIYKLTKYLAAMQSQANEVHDGNFNDIEIDQS